MFKYIKEILSQISPTQRLFALIIILFSISLILVGPKIVESLTHSDEEFVAITNRQREQIIELNSELSKLNLEMIKNKTECTNLIIEREKEILEMIEDLQRGLMFTRRSMVSEPTGGNGSNQDSIPKQRQIKQIDDDRVPILMEGLDRIKTKLKKDLQTSK